MRIRDMLSAIVLSLVLCGCEDNTDYSQHFKHTDDLLYKGTYVVRETYGSVFNTEANDNPALRQFKVLATDVDDDAKELAYSDLQTLRKQGYRIIIK